MKHYFDAPIGQFLYVTNRGEIAWGGGLPGISPTLGYSKTDGQEFIHVRMFPLLPNRTPPPAEASRSRKAVAMADDVTPYC